MLLFYYFFSHLFSFVFSQETCGQQGFGASGTYITSLKVNSACECRQQCQQQKGKNIIASFSSSCLAWQYIYNESEKDFHMCYLKNSSEMTTNMYSYSGVEGISVAEKVNSTIRLSLPYFGYGNEFIFQTSTDKQLNNILKNSGSSNSRFPGGTPADYWLWREGWITNSSGCGGCAQQPKRPAHVQDVANYLQATNQSVVLVLNQLESNLTEQLAMLDAYVSAGIRVRWIELGNEMYDATRPDVLEAYPSPSDYAEKMANWTAEISKKFPEAQIALVGLANDWDDRTRMWNKQVLQNPLSLSSHAATIHLYPGLPSFPLNPLLFPSLLATAFPTYLEYVNYTSTTIPSFFRLWVTEWGTWNNPYVVNTWIQALWHSAMVLLLLGMERIDIIMPYCLVCMDPNMPSFLSQYGPVSPPNATDANWTTTPSGQAYSLLFSVFGAANSVTQLSFSDNPVLDSDVPSSLTLLGVVSSDRISQKDTATLLNLGGLSRSVDLRGVVQCDSSEQCCASVYTSSSLTQPMLQMNTERMLCDTVFALPPFSLAVGACNHAC